MVQKDIDLCHPQHKSIKVLFNKHIYESVDLAKDAVLSRHLDAGELAVVRYYVDYQPGWDNGSPGYSSIRMLLAIGGLMINDSDDTYFFYDGETTNSSVNDTYTKEEIDNKFVDITTEYQQYVETYFTEEITDKINDIIPELISIELAKQLENLHVITTDTLDEQLSNSEYILTNIITPLSNVEKRIEQLDSSVLSLIGTTEEDWGEPSDWEWNQ